MATRESIDRKNRFIEFVANRVKDGTTEMDGTMICRQALSCACKASGIYGAPPAWIVHDVTRRDEINFGNGWYSVPEFVGKEMTSAAVAPAAAPTTVSTISTPKVDAEISQVLAMTGGESTTLVPEKISTYVPWGHFSDVEKIVSSGIFYPIFITGLSGNGKTTMVEQICAKLNREMYRVNITKQTDEDDLLGGFRLVNGETVWCDGPVVRAMKQGGVLLLDEIDLASHNIMCLQPVLEGKGIFLKKTGEWVKPASGFTIFATANTKGKGSDDGRFIGTNILNEAFLDRFSVTMEQEYAPKNVEKKIVCKIMDKHDAKDVDFAEKLVKWADSIRQCFYQDAVDEIITTRRLGDIVTAYSVFGDRLKAITMAVSRFDDSTKESFITMYSKIDDTIGASSDKDATEMLKNMAADGSMDLSQVRVDLAVDYKDKDHAKSFGCKFDNIRKVWYTDGQTFLKHVEQLGQYNPHVIEGGISKAPF